MIKEKYEIKQDMAGIWELLKHGKVHGRFISKENAEIIQEQEESLDGMSRCVDCEQPLNNCVSFQDSGQCQTCWYSAEGF